MRKNHKEQILQYIRSSYKERGFPPSMAEIALASGLSSRSSVHEQLRQLVDDGLLLYRDRKYLPVNAIGTQSDMVMVPIIGTIAAGTPIEAIEDFEGYIPFLPPHRCNDRNLFALHVRGDSMIEVGINDGDIVIVEQRPDAENGQIVAAMIEGEATVKRFYAEDGHYRLQPENSTMNPIIVNEVEILGRVISSQRYY